MVLIAIAIETETDWIVFFAHEPQTDRHQHQQINSHNQSRGERKKKEGKERGGEGGQTGPLRPGK
jgi:hypothetical protein